MFSFKSLTRSKTVILALLSFLLAFLEVAGWQSSMRYQTSVHRFLSKIGMLNGPMCIVAGLALWAVFFLVFYLLFGLFDKVGADRAVTGDLPGLKYLALWSFLALAVIYMILLIGCYPGYYNYDMGNQLPQIMYKEVPFNAHHPLIHTIVGGGLITVGYHLRDVDLTFGIFLYCAFQMLCCAACFGYTLKFVYKRTASKVITLIGFLFYALCPPVVMFTMSTTKDVLCYAVLLVAVVMLYEIYEDTEADRPVALSRLIFAALWLALSCLLRKNVIYGVVVFTIYSLIAVRRKRKQQLIFFAAVILTYLVVNNGLIMALDAPKSNTAEALSVPFQQLARLYIDKGPGAFTPEELELLYNAIDEEMIYTYDPIIADNIKTSFWLHMDTIMDNKGTYLGLWFKKLVQNPGTYVSSFLDNTYQAWYPGTVLQDHAGYRYFDITDWQAEYGRPAFPALYEFYKGIRFCSYRDIPVVRLLFSTGAMFWLCIIAWFYALWSNKKGGIHAMLLALLSAATSLMGPVSDVRYYLILFYLLPVCLAMFLGCKKDREASVEE